MDKEVFQKYKLALRKYLLNNKEKVSKDLEEMREKSNHNNMNKETKFKVGDKAHKTKGYKFPCTIVGVFETIKGDIRVVGEMDEFGLLHIFNEDQLDKVTEPINNEVKSKWDL